jgi:hypothetical protein
MLKLMIILALWITPGILLFLYLFWVSKGHGRRPAQLELPLAEPTVLTPVTSGRQPLELSQTSTPTPTHRERREMERFA